MHQIGQAAANGQAQAGATVAARGGTVGLLKVLKQPGLRVFGNADAAVLHLEAQLQHRAFVLLDAGGHADKARVGELHRIAGKVQQHFGDALRIAQQRLRQQPRVQLDLHLQVFFGRRLGQQVGDVVQHIADLERRVCQLQFAGLDLRKIEHVVDDGEQVLGRERDLLQPRLLLGLGGVALHQIGQANDGVHRRADLVAHVRQEGTFGQARRLGRLRRRSQLGRALGDQYFEVVAVVAQLLFVADLLGNVGQKAVPQHAVAVFLLGDGIAVKPALLAVRRQGAELLLPGRQVAARGQQRFAHGVAVVGMNLRKPGLGALRQISGAEAEIVFYRLAHIGKREHAALAQPQLIDHAGHGFGHAAQPFDQRALGVELLLQRVAHVFEVAAQLADFIRPAGRQFGVETPARQVIGKTAQLAQRSHHPRIEQRQDQRQRSQQLPADGGAIQPALAGQGCGAQVVVDLDLDVADAVAAAKHLALAARQLALVSRRECHVDEGSALRRVLDDDTHHVGRFHDGGHHLAGGHGVQVPEQFGQAAGQHVELGFQLALLRCGGDLRFAQADQQAADDQRRQQQPDARAQRNRHKQRA